MNEQSRKKKTLHNANCCVYRCSSRKNNNRSLHFHAFPKKDASTVYVTNAFGILEKVDRRKAWTKVLLMEKPVTNSMRVCSLHFQESDYLAKGAALISMNRPRLKATAVPSCNLPKIQHTRKLQQANDFPQKQRFDKRSILRDSNTNPPTISEASHSHDAEHGEEIEHKPLEFADLTEKEQCVVQSLLDLQFAENKTGEIIRT